MPAKREAYQLSPKNPVQCYAISIETGNPGIPHEVTEIPSNLQSPALKCQSTGAMGRAGIVAFAKSAD
jgi:hypothetical protein